MRRFVKSSVNSDTGTFPKKFGAIMLKVHFRSVGVGDNIILEFPNGRVGIVDCNSRWRQCIDFLSQRNGTQALEFVAATHLHADHIDGLLPILSHYEGRVNQFWDSGLPRREGNYLRLLQYLETHPEIRYLAPRSGTVFRQGDVQIQVLSPPPILLRNTLSDINNASLVLRLEYTPQFSLLLAADAQFESWAKMVLEHPGQLSSRVLKVSHHGSNYGTNLEVLRRIRPEFAVISVARHERYQFPHPEALGFLQTVCSPENVLRTDVDGNISILYSPASGLQVLRQQD
jgi:competence protein ComEC